MLEGTSRNIPPQGGRKHPEQQYIQMDTTQILFICGGTFVGLEDVSICSCSPSELLVRQYFRQKLARALARGRGKELVLGRVLDDLAARP